MSMVTVQLFAAYADLVGSPSIDVPLGQADTVSDLIRNLRTLPRATGLPPTPRVAINRSFATGETPVRLGDEIALIPPVAGG